MFSNIISHVLMFENAVYFVFVRMDSDSSFHITLNPTTHFGPVL
jgi:hypothetical protein